MGVILSVLGVILLVFATILALVLLALVLPVRFGVEALGDMGFDEGVANIRIYGGVVGGGFRVRRTVSDPATPWRGTLGLMLWRWFIPIYSRNLGAESKEPEPQRKPPDSTPFAPDDFDASDFVIPEEASDPTRIPDEKDTVPEPPEEPRQESVKAESKPETVVRSEAKTAKRVKPKPQGAKPRRKSALRKFRETIARMRALFAEWWPVFTGVLRRLRGVIRVTQFHVDGELGLNDPAITGQMVGYLTAMRGLSVRSGILARLGLDRGALRISVLPSFDGYVVRGRIATELRLSLIRIWWAALFAGWKVFRRYRATRVRENQAHESQQSAATSSMAA